ncbi:HAMP domain-containing sensor histidine kinase [Paenibacillus sp. Marseille-Q4541]|uniref:sensor histidine kinase n=1 Tax=Paenibacillus sp. Marseille-Q4541 TaxID=2831522 RepID=UPI002019F70F|nr:HAMP domain-containing sensor histidine kinase [Paenibacillus sp. Marseille-Q4541]
MMKKKKYIGLKWKVALLLALLLFSVLALLSSLVLAGIREDQRERLTDTFAQKAEAASIRVHQEFLTNTELTPDTFMENLGQRLAVDLGEQSAAAVTLYKLDGTFTGTSLPFQPKMDVKDALEYTAEGCSAYITEGDQILYLAPLYNLDEQMGTIQFHSSIAEQRAFYERIQNLFVITGAAVLVAGFLIGFGYVWRQVHVISKLNGAANQIGEGKYLTALPVQRNDELGELAEGIYEMSSQISSSMGQLTEEKIKLQDANVQLQKLEQQQKHFIGNISHELKTPLTSILAYADLLEMYQDDPILLEEARVQISKEAQRLYGLVEKALQLSSMDVYEFQNRAESVEIKPLLQEAVTRLEAKAEKYHITLKATLNEGEVWADPENLMHIVVNLLDNGIKYNRPGGSVILSNVLSWDQNGKACMTIEVSDTGIGIPEDEQALIFKPFYTISSDRSRANGGTGLGLSLVRSLAEKQHGSVILAESSPQGSKFIVTLPVEHHGEHT